MGAMMGGTYMWAWILLWTVLGLALAVTASVVIARALGWHNADQPQISPAGPSAAQQAQDALRLRYGKGEISREEYLQGKVELEDLPSPVACSPACHGKPRRPSTHGAVEG